MSQNEDYLDSLLSSITQAKTTDSISTKSSAYVSKEPETCIDAEDDFFEAFGINPRAKKKESSRNNLKRIFKKKDFLADFEDEFESGDADSFINEFEEEIAQEEAEFALNGTTSAEQYVSDLFAEEVSDTNVEDANSIDLAGAETVMNQSVDLIPVEDGEEISGEEDSLPTESESLVDPEFPLEELDEQTSDEMLLPEESLESDLDSSDMSVAPDAMNEFAPDELDVGFEGSDLDADSDLGEFDMDSILESTGEGSGDDIPIDELNQIGDEIVKNTEEDLENDKSKKKKKDKGPNPIVEKLKIFFFGKPDEDDAEEEQYLAEQKVIKAQKKEQKEQEKAAKAEQKKADSDAKAKAAKEAKAAKPVKEAKPPKPKKPKKVDNSPKIPIKVIAIFLALAGSLLAITIIGTKLLGTNYQMGKAREIYMTGDYQAAYLACNGLDLSKPDDIKFRGGVRVLADLSSAIDESQLFYSRGDYDMALDSLILATGRYNDNKDMASDYGVGSEYDYLGRNVEAKLMEWYEVDKEYAISIYRKPNRRRYTIELKKILIEKGYLEF